MPPNGDTQWTYGMALDADGHPWIAGAATVYHFDPDTEQWDFINVPGREHAWPDGRRAKAERGWPTTGRRSWSRSIR